VKKENEMEFQRAEMRIIRWKRMLDGWICGVEVIDRFIFNELR